MPIKLHGHFLLADDEARSLVSDLAKLSRRMADEAEAEHTSAHDGQM